MARLTGRNVVITGAAQGIGAIYAKAVAAEGAAVCVSDLVSTDATVAAIREAGGRAIGISCDVTDGEAVARMIAEADAQLGGIHGLVNNAALFGTLAVKPLDQVSSAEFDKIMTVNIRGAFECIKSVLPVMRRQRYGKIVNIASGTVFKGAANMVPYVTSKGAIVAMTRSVAREVGDDFITVNCLAPGLTNSDAVKGDEAWGKRGSQTVASRCIKREEEPEDLTGSVIFLLSADSDFMTGQVMVVDGGAVTH